MVMKTYRDLKVGDTLYVVTGELTVVTGKLMIETAVILRIREELDYVRFDLLGEITNRTYSEFVNRDNYNKGTWSLTSATNLKDIKRVKAIRTAYLNKCFKDENIPRTWSGR